MQRNIIGAYDIMGRGWGYGAGPYTAFGADAPALPPAASAPCEPYQYPYGYPYGYSGGYGGGMAACGGPWNSPGNWSQAQCQAFQAAIASRGSAVVVDTPPSRAREQYLGFQEGPLDAGETASFIATPAQVFKGHRLVIPSDIGGQILVRNITVGNMPQLVNAAGAGAIPGRMFSEFSTDELINFDTAQISQQITLQVTNFSGPDIPIFAAGLKGVAVMP